MYVRKIGTNGPYSRTPCGDTPVSICTKPSTIDSQKDLDVLVTNPVCVSGMCETHEAAKRVHTFTLFSILYIGTKTFTRCGEMERRSDQLLYMTRSPMDGRTYYKKLRNLSYFMLPQ